MQKTDVVVPSELPVPREVFSVAEAAELGRQIKASVQKVATDVLETAKLCLRAYERYGSQGLSVVLRAADMEKTKFLKHTAIARDQRLGRIATQLPTSYSILYEITQLSDEVFEEAAKERIIHPDARRGDIDAPHKPNGRRGKQIDVRGLPAAVREMEPGSRLVFVIPVDIRADQCEQVKQRIGALLKKFDLGVLPITDLQAVKVAEAPINASVLAGSPVNKPTVVPQPLAPSKLPRVGASPPVKSSS